MPFIITEATDADTPMICPFCRAGTHETHLAREDKRHEGPTPEPGACWGWDRISDQLCKCEWRPNVS